MTFRTQTGQTGRDAYLYEATAIANAQRELNAKFRSLVNTMHIEDPELFSEDDDFAWSGADSASLLVDHLLGKR